MNAPVGQLHGHCASRRQHGTGETSSVAARTPAWQPPAERSCSPSSGRSSGCSERWRSTGGPAGKTGRRSLPNRAEVAARSGAVVQQPLPSAAEGLRNTTSSRSRRTRCDLLLTSRGGEALSSSCAPQVGAPGVVFLRPAGGPGSGGRSGGRVPGWSIPAGTWVGGARPDGGRVGPGRSG